MTLSSPSDSVFKKILCMPVVISALGYFVDIYDLLLFAIVRIPSLKSIGVSAEGLQTEGEKIISIQMLGLLLGGFIWGILGDKKGRLSVLFGSILIYSLANIANGFVTTVEQYALVRFIAGIGLAGELGAGITLVAEVLPTHLRGYGTTIVATFGLFGAIVANFISYFLDWRTCYFIGGGLGIALLVMRISVAESGMFHQTKEKGVERGDIFKLLFNKERLLRFIYTVLVGIPIWFVIGILVAFAPEFSMLKGIANLSAGDAIMYGYAGLAAGDLLSGFGSQWIRSRKKMVLLFIVITGVAIAGYLYLPFSSGTVPLLWCFALGFGVGYWALFVTMATEQFGTDLRATVTTIAPNLVRGSLPLLVIAFKYLRADYGLIHSAAMVGLFTVVVALFSLTKMQETFSKELNFEE